MSNLSPAQKLDEDLRLLMHDMVGAPNTVRERVWGCNAGAGRTVEESRALYRVPIVEAFAASGAETLAEFPEAVRTLQAQRSHAAETIATLEETIADHELTIDAYKANDEAFALRNEVEKLRSENAAYQTAAREMATERDRARANAADCHNRNACIMSERDAEAAEEDRLRAELDGAQRQLRHVIGIKEKQATELEESEHKAGVLRQQLVNLREECARLYAIETRLTRRVKWAMARIEDLLLKGDL